MKMGETDSADKFMVLVVEYFTYLFLLKQWEEGMNYKLVNHKLLSKLMVKMWANWRVNYWFTRKSFWKSCRICYNP
jgi:hypothetical protein